MRNAHPTVLGALLGATAFLAGCGGGGTTDPTVGTSQARLVLSSTGGNAAALHVTATDSATSAVVLDRTIDVGADGTTVLSLSLPTAGYTFAASVAGGLPGDDEGQAEVTLDPDALAEVSVVVQAGAGGPATVHVGVDFAPVIHAITVHPDVDDGAATGVVVDVHATEHAGGALRYFWSGPGLRGTVQGDSTVTLPMSAVIAAAAAGQAVVHVVVEDAAGTVTKADAVLTVTGGAVQSTMPPRGNGDDACIEAQEQCRAGCTSGIGLSAGMIGASASCVDQCALTLASCKAH